LSTDATEHTDEGAALGGHAVSHVGVICVICGSFFSKASNVRGYMNRTFIDGNLSTDATEHTDEGAALGGHAVSHVGVICVICGSFFSKASNVRGYMLRTFLHGYLSTDATEHTDEGAALGGHAVSHVGVFCVICGSFFFALQIQ